MASNVVHEVVDVKLHVLEDDGMISWMGKKEFIELCIYDTNGWQGGVSFLAVIFGIF